MPTQEIAPRPVELADPAPAGHAVDHTWADEKGPRSAEATGQADDADGLRHILPTAAADADAIGQIQLISLGAQINQGDFFPVATPFPTTEPAGAKAARLVQSSGRHPPCCVLHRSAVPIRSRPSCSFSRNHLESPQVL